MAKQKIRIRLKAYDHRVLDQSAKRIVETAERTGARVVGPVPLPTRIERFTIRRSTFIDKDSHEHFEIRTHNRLIDVLDPDSKTIDMLMRLNLPAGVDIEIKIEVLQHLAQAAGCIKIEALADSARTILSVGPPETHLPLGRLLDCVVVRDDAVQPRLTVPKLFCKETTEIC